METVDKEEAVLTPTRDDPSTRIVMMPASTDPQRALADIAQQRAADQRRSTMKRGAQGLFVLSVLVAALTVPRLREHGRAAAPATATAPVAALANSTPQLAAPSLPMAPAPAGRTAEPAIALPEDPAARCQVQFKAHQWRNARESCGAAFEASPSPTLAMHAAHAHWASGDAAGAGHWARNALELESTDPDAHVLLGNAEHAAGNRRKAIAAYRRYLELAPRGWHAERLRAYMHGRSATEPTVK